ncbi:MAG: hypothetical protein LC796_09415 [Acidobacteria bacterium]|nr:hypothetical protein [Acidobacteriota bacterium]MCA1609960.1 hypothetical protein [Acidobacteriota bacterium]
MKLARPALLAAALALLLWREPARYHAEREIRAATEALRYVLTHSSELPDAAGALDRIASVARAAAPPLPGDARPLVLEGSARLVRGEPKRALEIYRKANDDGERAETDLNLARALERLGREEDARAAFVRAAWVSPALLRAMLPDAADTARARITAFEHDLKAGRLKEPPPLPR